VPTAVFAATEDFGSTADGRLAVRTDRAAAELAALLIGPGSTPRSAPRPDAFDDVTPFEQLLRGQ
jgi:FMN reductase